MDLASCFMSFESGMSPSISIFKLVPYKIVQFPAVSPVVI